MSSRLYKVEGAKELILEFWAIMDNVSDKLVESLFAPQGELVIDTVTSPLVRVSGREQLASFGLKRSEAAASTKRVTRHIVSNLRVTKFDASAITLSGHVTDYVGSGDLPIRLNSPAVVADFSYEVAFAEDGSASLTAVAGKVIFDGKQ